MAYQISKVHVVHPGTHTSHITHVQLSNNQTYTVQQIIGFIRQGHQFYTHAGNRVANVYVARTHSGHEYIKTEPDDTKKDNLLYLERF